jgi:hypothetical protein
MFSVLTRRRPCLRVFQIDDANGLSVDLDVARQAGVEETIFIKRVEAAAFASPRRHAK